MCAIQYERVRSLLGRNFIINFHTKYLLPPTIESNDLSILLLLISLFAHGFFTTDNTTK